MILLDKSGLNSGERKKNHASVMYETLSNLQQEAPLALWKKKKKKIIGFFANKHFHMQETRSNCFSYGLWYFNQKQL